MSVHPSTRTNDHPEQAPRHPAAIQTLDLTKVYGDHTALRGLSIDVAEGSIFGLLGPNGAGKSTTIKILTTLSRATSGSATVTGIDVDTHPQEVRRRIGVVTQRPSTDPVATGRENLVLAARIHGLGSRAARHRTTELLDRFDLAEAADRPVRTYSGGMQRKLDVAVGLVHTPKVLFLDEPTTGLDPQARAEMWAEIARLAAQERLSILLSTHYLEEADQLADQVAILDRGAIVAAGTPEQLKGQLHGDSVVTEVAADSDLATATETVRRLEPDSDVSTEGRRVRVRVDDGPAAVPRILAALDHARIDVLAITVARPSLDDVYLRHTGRTLAHAHSAVQEAS